MRTEQEVQQMIDAIKVRYRIDHATRFAMIALLENVLRGPEYSGECGCLGPKGMCVCEARSLVPTET